MHRLYLEHAPAWTAGFTSWLPERVTPIRRVGYSLRHLAQRGLIDPAAFEDFCSATGLADLGWRMLWSDTDGLPDDRSVAAICCQAEGVLVFIHGWDGSGEVWEDIPARILRENPRLVVLVPDVNGFGATPFADPSPSHSQCDPPALMEALRRWLALLQLRAPAGGHVRPFIFVGHSMGGAALFFMEPADWLPGELGRIATAPALLMNDRARQRFYRTLGAGIRFSGWSDLANRVAEDIIAPRVIEALAGGASEAVRAEHHRIFRETPEGVIARTFEAMGLLDAELTRNGWQDFHVFLAHRDRLVGLQPTLDLLADLHFNPAQVRIALGDHYFFSIGKDAHLHAQNRDLLIQDILSLHAGMLARQEDVSLNIRG